MARGKGSTGGFGGKSAAQAAKRDKWLHGKSTTTTTGRGKGRSTRTTTESQNPNWKPTQDTKTGAGKFKKEKFVAGANVLDESGKVGKTLTFEESLAAGSRADDPRNWEFYYDEKKVGSGYGKDLTKAEKKSQARRSARGKAEREAKLVGKDVYETMRYEYQAKAVGAEAKAATAKSKASGRFGSTRVAKAVDTQQQMARRRTGRARSLATEESDKAIKSPTKSARLV
jgi:hypothetical protein